MTSRKKLVARLAERLARADPDAPLFLALNAISDDPDIPEATKAALRRRLLIEDRHARPVAYRDEDVYSAVMQAGGTLTAAARTVAAALGIGERTVRKHYYAHMKRHPNCRGLDGRRKAGVSGKNK